MAVAKDVLIIDDDRDLVASIRIILESQGYAVRAAHNSRDGFALIEAWAAWRHPASGEVLHFDLLFRRGSIEA